MDLLIYCFRHYSALTCRNCHNVVEFTSIALFVCCHVVISSVFLVGLNERFIYIALLYDYISPLAFARKIATRETVPNFERSLNVQPSCLHCIRPLYSHALRCGGQPCSLQHVGMTRGRFAGENANLWVLIVSSIMIQLYTGTYCDSGMSISELIRRLKSNKLHCIALR